MKKISIVTTACVPWLTGTSINPLYRAIALSELGFIVTLYVPYVKKSDQPNIFNHIFTVSEQKKYLETHFLKKSGIKEVCFYPAKCHLYDGKPSLFPDIRIDKLMNHTDIIILEEPEHLLWLNPLQNFKSKANKVIGIIHTNYLSYLKYSNSNFLAWIIKYYSRILLRMKCSKIIHLSQVTKELFPKGDVIPLNGVRDNFFISNLKHDSCGIYTCAKLIFEKGYKELIDLLSSCDYNDEIHCYGKGYDNEQITLYANSKNVNLRFYGEVDNPSVAFNKYKIFINTSRSEVLCTTTAESIVMGKIVIIPKHPSNESFYHYTNVFLYNNAVEFKSALDKAKILNSLSGESNLEELRWINVTSKYLIPLLGVK
ncbi:MAG: digalactosyldiacylglycerol synthase [Pseudomonadota bacterium]|nr:digalactosyldiacylglycerol synthase [Pseudomonadota bacterium]